MSRPWNGAMPVLLTLPLRIDHYRRVRRRRRRGLAIAALLVLGLGLLAAGFWLPAKAELAQHLFGRAWPRTADTQSVARLTLTDHRDMHSRAIATLELGDELTLEQPDGALLTYAVDALDIVDSSRADFRPDVGENLVVLVNVLAMRLRGRRRELALRRDGAAAVLG